MRILDIIAATLLVVGGLNWGLVALFEFDAVAAISGLRFGETSNLTDVLHGLIGLSALYQIFFLRPIRHRWHVHT